MGGLRGDGAPTQLTTGGLFEYYLRSLHPAGTPIPNSGQVRQQFVNKLVRTDPTPGG